MKNLVFKGLVKTVSIDNLIYLERIGKPEDVCMQTWQDFWRVLGPNIKMSEVEGVLAISQMDPKTQIIQYRAAIASKTPIEDLPADFKISKFEIKDLARWELKGGYEHLPAAYQEIFKENLKSEGLSPRHDFSLEKYVNSPENTPKEDLITHIDIPIAS